ncbi:MAG: hypothetical protein R3F42_15865 [Pseudomonadota bacterium]
MRLALTCLMLLTTLLQPLLGQAVQLTTGLGSADYPDYRIDTNGFLHLVWHDATVDNGAVMYKLFDTAGVVRIPDIQINNSSGSANTTPVTALDAANRLFVVWQDLADQEIYIMRLQPLLDDLDPATPAVLATIKPVLGGVADQVRVSSPTDGWPARNPAMAVAAGGFLHLVWESGAGGPVQYVKLDAEGQPQTTILDLSAAAGTTGSGNDLPDIAVDSAGHVHVVFTQAGATAADEVYYAMIDGSSGALRIAPTLLSVDDGLRAGNATVSVNLADNRVYVVYKQATTLAGSGDEQIYLDALDPALDDQNGGPADPAVMRLHRTALTSTPAQSAWHVFSRIGYDRRVHAIYMDYDAVACPSGVNYSIFNTQATYDGVILANDILTQTGATLGCNPQARLAPRGDRVVWADNATGNLEIYSAGFARADAGSRGYLTCSLGDPHAGAARAGELWLLLAFIAILWRWRGRRHARNAR